jgi:hypothetical protein
VKAGNRAEWRAGGRFGRGVDGGGGAGDGGEVGSGRSGTQLEPLIPSARSLALGSERLRRFGVCGCRELSAAWSVAKIRAAVADASYHERTFFLRDLVPLMAERLESEGPRLPVADDSLGGIGHHRTQGVARRCVWDQGLMAEVEADQDRGVGDRQDALCPAVLAGEEERVVEAHV